MKVAQRIDWNDVRARLAANEKALHRGLEPTADELNAVLARRAAALADRAASRLARADEDRILVVVLGDARFGMPIARLAEVVPLKRLTTVPRGPAGLLGVMNLRGEVRSVVDLRAVLQIDGDRDDADGYVLMVRRDGKEIGLYVDQVEGIRSVERTSLAPASEAHFVAGMLPDRIGLLDVDAVLAHDVFLGNETQRA